MSFEVGVDDIVIPIVIEVRRPQVLCIVVGVKQSS